MRAITRTNFQQSEHHSISMRTTGKGFGWRKVNALPPAYFYACAKKYPEQPELIITLDELFRKAREGEIKWQEAKARAWALIKNTFRAAMSNVHEDK